MSIIGKKDRIRLKYGEYQFGMTASRNGVVVHVSNYGKHYTVIFDDYRLTVHETIEDIDEHGRPFININLPVAKRRIERLLSNDLFMNELSRRLHQSLKHMVNSEQLTAQGVAFLNLPISISHRELVAMKEPLDISYLVNLIPVEIAWESESGTGFLAYDSNGTMIGNVFTFKIKNRKRVYFVSTKNIINLFEWLGRELLGADLPTVPGISRATSQTM